MTEKSVFSVPEYQAPLSDYQIENASASPAERAAYEFQRSDVEPLTPPIFPGTERSHTEVATVREEVVAEQPSTVEQMNALTDAQIYEYVDTMTVHQAQIRSQFVLAA